MKQIRQHDFFAGQVTKQPTKNGFVLPIWVSPLAWKGYEEMRRKIKRPLTSYAKTLALKRLETLMKEGSDPTEVLEQSIFNCWQGLFPIQNNGRQIEENEIVVKQAFGKRTA